MQIYAKKFLKIYKVVNLNLSRMSTYFLKYWNFSFRTCFFLIQNHPFQAFLVSKTYMYFCPWRKNYIFAHIFVRYGGGGFKCLSGHVRLECKFFFDGSPKVNTTFRREQCMQGTFVKWFLVKDKMPAIDLQHIRQLMQGG